MSLRSGAIIGVAAVALVAHGEFHRTAMAAQQAPAARPAKGGGPMVPQFQFDKTWPKPLPNLMKVGHVAGVSVDSHDHIWIVQRPSSLKASEVEATAGGAYGGQAGPNSGCCRPAPEVIEFDQQGNMVQAWGPQGKQDWPTPAPKSKDTAYGTLNAGERGLFVDVRDNVWIGSDGPGDTFAIKLSKFGKPYLTLGKKGGKSGGSNDTATLNGASGMVVDPASNEVYVADGARNRRVIVFDGYKGDYLRHWGAYGKKPDDSVAMKPDSPNPDAPQFGDVSAIALSHDKMLYVGDRANNRIQVFTEDGTFVKQGVIGTTLGGTVFGIAFSAEPDQKFVYVADGSNEKIWILARSSMEVLGSFGSGGHNGGQFTTVYDIATDSKGNIYAGETWEGKRVQRFLYKGLAPAAR